jgi:hypothetical protein
MAGCTKLELWNAKTSCSLTKGEEDEGATGVEILKTKETPDGASPPIQQELHELREYPKETSEPATVRGGLLTKLISHWLNKYSLKNEMPLHREIETMKGDTRMLAAYIQVTKKDRDALTLEVKILRDPCKDTAAREEQLNLIAVEQYKLIKDSGSLMYEAICISEEKETMTKDREKTESADQLNQITVESNELRKGREPLICEAACISEEKGAMMNGVDARKLEVEQFRGQFKKATALEEQLNRMTVECNELRKDREALIYEAISISEEKEAITKDRNALKLEVEKLRGQCKKATTLEEQLNQMTVESNELRKDREALIYEVISISEEKEDIKRDRDVLTLEIENVRIEFGRKF